MTVSSEGGREKRSTAVQRKKARGRQNYAEKLRQQRQREEQVRDGIDAFAAADGAIQHAQERADKKIAEYQSKIDEAQATADAEKADQHTAKAVAVLQIHEANTTAPDIAEILELSTVKQVRQLLADARAARAASSGEPLTDTGVDAPEPVRDDASASSWSAVQGDVGSSASSTGAESVKQAVPAAATVSTADYAGGLESEPDGSGVAPTVE